MDFFILNQTWELKQRDPQAALEDDFNRPSGWIAASVPGVVQQDLMHEGLIPDPFYGLNENEVQWVGEVDWLYRTRFEVPDVLLQAGGNLDLCLDGLDTFANVWLNGSEILSSDNMFVPWRLAVKSLLRPGPNELQVLFESAIRRGHEREQHYGARYRWNETTDSSRLYVRKAQYHYGWDWGPTLITAGIWRGVRLEAYTARLHDLACPVELSEDLSRASLPVSLEIAGTEGQPELVVELNLYGPDGRQLDQATLPVAAGSTRLNHAFELNQPELWWVRGYGSQPFYRLEARLVETATGREYDSQHLRLGIRQIRLIQEPLEGQPGRSFYFEVNRQPIFCGGANWIPADSFLPRVTKADYARTLRQMAEANMTMVRVWGGGIYEEDVFYELCDELGILVWQDFMFACGMYPAHPEFQVSVRAEAEANVRRLRHHPSLALWCGNNEDYLVAQAIQAYDPDYQGDLAASPFPARALYEGLLPEVCAALAPTTPYWPGSPYGGADANNQTIGDRHTWEVWHGNMASYHAYGQYQGRFVSEFGMAALPVLETVTAFAPPAERFIGSRTLEHHNKAAEGARRLAVYMSDTVRPPTDLEEYIYATQLVQAEAMATAVRLWRREWAGPQHYGIGGALVWQINDCWPVTSWALVDYYGRPKPALYALRRELAALTLGWEQPGIHGAIRLWALNGTFASVEARLILQNWSLSGHLLHEEQQPVPLLANRSTELNPSALATDQPQIRVARLEVEGQEVAQAVLWPEPFKYYQTDPNSNNLQIRRLDRDRLELSTDRPAKGVWLSADDGLEVGWSDNMLDLLPGTLRQVSGAGLDRLTSLNVRWLTGAQRFDLS